jgi:hypothetical protein
MQRPSALGLFLCDQVIFDRDNGKPTLVGIFDAIRCNQFPSPIKPMDAYAVITDGQGTVTLDLVVSSIESGEAITALSMEQDLSDPLAICHVRFRIRAPSFAAPGQYLFELLADGEPICHRRLHVRSSEEEP